MLKLVDDSLRSLFGGLSEIILVQYVLGYELLDQLLLLLLTQSGRALKVPEDKGFGHVVGEEDVLDQPFLVLRVYVGGLKVASGDAFLLKVLEGLFLGGEGGGLDHLCRDLKGKHVVLSRDINSLI